MSIKCKATNYSLVSYFIDWNGWFGMGFFHFFGILVY